MQREIERALAVRMKVPCEGSFAAFVIRNVAPKQRPEPSRARKHEYRWQRLNLPQINPCSRMLDLQALQR